MFFLGGWGEISLQLTSHRTLKTDVKVAQSVCGFFALALGVAVS